LTILKTRYVKIDEQGIRLNTLFRTIHHLGWNEVKQIDISLEHAIRTGGRSLRFYTKPIIKFIPYRAEDSDPIWMQYTRRAVKAIMKHSDIPIFDGRPPSALD
jgi:hypothetical protein